MMEPAKNTWTGYYSAATAAAGLLLLPALLFWYTFTFPLSFEDFEVNYVLGKFTGTEMLAQFGHSVTAFQLYYRPVGDLLSWLILKLAGPWELGEHLLCYLVLWLTACGILSLVYQLTRSWQSAFTAAFLYSIAPVQANYYLVANTYTFDRGVALFLVWALACAPTRCWWLSPVFTVAALASKDNALVTPGILAVLVALLWVRSRSISGEQNRKDFRNSVLAFATCLVVYGTFLGFKLYSAFVLKKGGLPVNPQLNPQIVLDLRPETILRNARIHLMFHMEAFSWWKLPMRSLDTWLKQVPSARLFTIPVVYVLMFLAEVGYIIRHRARRGTLIPESIHLGAWWAILATLPMLFFREQYRVVSYMALLPAVGVSLVCAGVIFGLMSLSFRAIGTRKGWIRTVVYCVCWAIAGLSVYLWLPHAIIAKNYYRTHLQMGTQMLRETVSRSKQAGLPGKFGTAVLRGFTETELFVLYPSRSFPLLCNLPPHAVNGIASDQEIFRTATDGHQALALNPNSMVLNRLTDRTAVLRATATGFESLEINAPLENGSFQKTELFLGSKRPMYWIPYPIPGCPAWRLMSESGGKVLSLDDCAPGMDHGFRQSCFLRADHTYELSFRTRAESDGGLPAIDVLGARIPELVHRQVATASKGWTVTTSSIVVPRSDAYEIRLGNAGTTTSTIDWSMVEIKDAGITPNVIQLTETNQQSRTRLPLPRISKWPSTRVIVDDQTSLPITELYDESTTAELGWPVFTIPRDSQPGFLRNITIVASGRSSSGSQLDVRTSLYQRMADGILTPRNTFVVTMSFADRLSTQTSTISLSSKDEQVRFDFMPCSADKVKESTGSLLLSDVSLYWGEEIPATGEWSRK